VRHSGNAYNAEAWHDDGLTGGLVCSQRSLVLAAEPGRLRLGFGTHLKDFSMNAHGWAWVLTAGPLVLAAVFSHSQ